MESTVVAALVGIVAYIAVRMVSAATRKERARRVFRKEYEDILNKEEHKVKGRFEC